MTFLKLINFTVLNEDPHCSVDIARISGKKKTTSPERIGEYVTALRESII